MGSVAYCSVMWQVAGSSFVEHMAVGRCPLGGHLARVGAVLEGAGEEPIGGRQIPLLGHQHVNDLTVLVDRPVKIDQHPATFT